MPDSSSSRPRVVILVAHGQPVAVFRDSEAATAWLKDHATEVDTVYSLVEGVPPQDAAVEVQLVPSLLARVLPPQGDGMSSPDR